MSFATCVRVLFETSIDPARLSVIRPSGPTTFFPANSGLPGKSKLISSPGPSSYSAFAAGSKSCSCFSGLIFSSGAAGP